MNESFKLSQCKLQSVVSCSSFSPMSQMEIEIASRIPLPPSVSNLSFYSADTEALELEDRNSSRNSSALIANRSGGVEQALAPVDGGFKALSFVRPLRVLSI